jgi:hypothetical protein
MRMAIDINAANLPAYLNRSYGDFGYYNFGICCWQYDNRDGAIEWINTLYFITESKMDNVTGFRYWLKPGLNALFTPYPHVPTFPALNINGLQVNPATGQGYPIFSE